MVVCIYVRMCLVSFCYVILLSLDFNYLWLVFVTFGYNLFRSVKVGFVYVWLGLTTFCHLARVSVSIMGSLFKFLIARGSDLYMCWLFFKLHLARGSGSIMGSLVGGRGRAPGRQDSLGSHSSVSEELASRC